MAKPSKGTGSFKIRMIYTHNPCPLDLFPLFSASVINLAGDERITSTNVSRIAFDLTLKTIKIISIKELQLIY